MSVAAKICGLSTLESVAAAVRGGARFVGFVFYPPSPRNVTPEQAAKLCAIAPTGVEKVGLFVDADDAALSAAIAAAPLDLLQFHGRESPERVAEVKRRFGRPVMKAIPVAAESDLAVAERFYGVADRLLFDAKPPKDSTEALPGGNGLVFDWRLLGERRWPLPWMLSGGLTAWNLGDAARITHASAVDVSSGVERAPGVKDLDKIAA
ncbi:MAG TPA: phosphoribosylanthranilate isomerase, partial [Stellaceae bacterium]|nr:phosphoribosylanthranilate isomerase [Stellaceae bacterium]